MPPQQPQPAAAPYAPQVYPGQPPQGQPYPPQPYVQQPYAPATPKPPASPGTGMATASLVIGLVGILIACLNLIGMWPVTVLLGIVGLVLGFLGLKSVERKGQAIAGIVLNVLWILVGLMAFLFWAALIGILSAIQSGAAN